MSNRNHSPIPSPVQTIRLGDPLKGANRTNVVFDPRSNLILISLQYRCGNTCVITVRKKGVKHVLPHLYCKDMRIILKFPCHDIIALSCNSFYRRPAGRALPPSSSLSRPPSLSLSSPVRWVIHMRSIYDNFTSKIPNVYLKVRKPAKQTKVVCSGLLAALI